MSTQCAGAGSGPLSQYLIYKTEICLKIRAFLQYTLKNHIRIVNEASCAGVESTNVVSDLAVPSGPATSTVSCSQLSAQYNCKYDTVRPVRCSTALLVSDLTLLELSEPLLWRHVLLLPHEEEHLLDISARGQ